MDQRQYIQSLLKRYGLSQAKTATTPADVNVKLVKDDGVSKPVNQVNYQSMVCSTAKNEQISRYFHNIGKLWKYHITKLDKLSIPFQHS